MWTFLHPIWTSSGAVHHILYAQGLFQISLANKASRTTIRCVIELTELIAASSSKFMRASSMSKIGVIQTSDQCVASFQSGEPALNASKTRRFSSVVGPLRSLWVGIHKRLNCKMNLHFALDRLVEANSTRTQRIRAKSRRQEFGPMDWVRWITWPSKSSSESHLIQSIQPTEPTILAPTFGADPFCSHWMKRISHWMKNSALDKLWNLILFYLIHFGWKSVQLGREKV